MDKLRRIGLGVEFNSNHYATDEYIDLGCLDFIEYGLHVAQGIPTWVEDFCTQIDADLTLHPLDINLPMGLSETNDNNWLKRLVDTVITSKATALVSDGHWWYLGDRNSIWPRPAQLNDETAKNCKDFAIFIAESCNLPFRIENPPIDWLPKTDSIWHFLETASSAPGVEICLDISHLLQMEQNFQIAKRGLPDLFPWEKITEIHLAGYLEVEYLGKKYRLDEHNMPIPQKQLDLFAQLLEKIPSKAGVDICLEMEAGNPRDLIYMVDTVKTVNKLAGGNN